jgi:diguanylate cyclase (GGDEF)-like protein
MLLAAFGVFHQLLPQGRDADHVKGSLGQMPQPTSLPLVIDIDEGKCTNCQKCISACPVKFCNDGSGKIVKMNENLCVACGSCIVACEHHARIGIDDSAAFFDFLRAGGKAVAMVAPAAAVSFPGLSLNLNGWLKSIGVEACFDVSFGAELTVKSYADFMGKETPKTVIAQPCPAIVNYIEVYRPDLIPHLVPRDSPMLHSAKMIREFFPQFAGHKIAAISPCYAKKREFAATGMVDFNVTMASLNKHLVSNQIALGDYPALDYEGPAAERASLFSTPGGLMQTFERWNPNATKITRKIEGTELVYRYLSTLKQSIEDGISPALVDCLNCEMGCNGGTGTLCNEMPFDAADSYVKARSLDLIAKYQKKGPFAEGRTHKGINKVLDKYWKEGLYNRDYMNRTANDILLQPSEEEITKIFESMSKYSKADLFNCMSCGYGNCRDMAIAIHNGLNRSGNCAKYMDLLIEKKNIELSGLVEQLKNLAETDALTELLNRRKFNEIITREWHRSLRSGVSLALIIIDVDFFKNYNDSYGHLKGDDCLKMVGHLLKEKFRRANEFVARYGGEEFAVVMAQSEMDEGIAACHRLIEAVTSLAIPHGHSKAADHVTVSAGIVAHVPHEGESLEDFINRADQALYKAKETGRNRFVVAEE